MFHANFYFSRNNQTYKAGTQVFLVQEMTITIFLILFFLYFTGIENKPS